MRVYFGNSLNYRLSGISCCCTHRIPVVHLARLSASPSGAASLRSSGRNRPAPSCQRDRPRSPRYRGSRRHPPMLRGWLPIGPQWPPHRREAQTMRLPGPDCALRSTISPYRGGRCGAGLPLEGTARGGRCRRRRAFSSGSADLVAVFVELGPDQLVAGERDRGRVAALGVEAPDLEVRHVVVEGAVRDHHVSVALGVEVGLEVVRAEGNHLVAGSGGQVSGAAEVRHVRSPYLSRLAHPSALDEATYTPMVYRVNTLFAGAPIFSAGPGNPIIRASETATRSRTGSTSTISKRCGVSRARGNTPSRASPSIRSASAVAWSGNTSGRRTVSNIGSSSTSRAAPRQS